MAAKDLFHDAVKTGLEKEGWKITADPLKVDFGDQADPDDIIVYDPGKEALIKWLE